MTTAVQGITLQRGVSVVIPTYNRCDDLRRTVSALFGQTFPAELVDLLVVDNSSTDATHEWCREMSAEHGRFQYLCKEPEGPAAARNAGISSVHREYTLFLDSDVELTPSWIAAAVSAMDSERSLGCVGGQVVYAHARSRLNAFGGEMGAIGIGWDFAEGSSVSVAAERRYCLWMNCSAMMVRTHTVRELGGFDTQFFYGFEDSDLGWRFNISGYRVAVLRDLVAIHHVDAAVAPSDDRIVFHYTKNRIRSVLKNYGPMRLLVLGTSSVLVTLVDSIVRAPRTSKLRAVLWNATHLRETLGMRRDVQKLRVVRDSELRQLFARSWFPPTRLAGNRRRPLAGLRVGAKADVALRDDRVQ